uniref:Triosephosphate isomerase n=1 Tax=candidate division WOR-3 bacterium TaxID=2052148 RepID=A0A7C4YRP0_UNCW3
MRRYLIAGNWKMNLGGKDALNCALEIENGIEGLKDGVEVMIAPPFTSIPILSDKLKKVKLGAQNMFYEEKGAYTGEISPIFLLDFNVKYVILGHSERRKYFKEDDELIVKKAKKAKETGFKFIVCVGETIEEREKGLEKKVVEKQVRAIIEAGIVCENLIFAYEPVWAIGTGKVATPEIAEEMHRFIKGFAKENMVIYGGSVDDKNAKGLLEMPNIDGALVGGASLKPEKFLTIIKTAENLL